MNAIEIGTSGDPRCILTGNDRAFYASLPEQFPVYRGCYGISGGTAAMGVCWTTKREIAEWFAHRAKRQGLAGEPVLVTAQVRDRAVRIAKAFECEVVVSPSGWEALECREHDSMPTRHCHPD